MKINESNGPFSSHPISARLVGALMVVLLTLGGCSGKPPGCSDGQVSDAIHNVITEASTQEMLVNLGRSGELERSGNPAKARSDVEAFFQNTKLKLSNVVSNGYNAESKTHSCTADVMFSLNGEPVSGLRTSYLVQATEDAKGKFLVEVQNGALLANMLITPYWLALEKAQKQQNGSNAGQAPAPSPQAGGCIDAKMASWKKEWDGRQQKLMDEAEREKREFRPLSPVQEDEAQEAAMQKAKQECTK